jgi:hypothetical protein
VLAEHSSAELTEWRAYEQAFGSLSPEDDYRAGVVAAEMRNASGGVPLGEGPKAGSRAAQPSDYFPRLSMDDDDGQGREPRRTTHDDVEPADEPATDDVTTASEQLKGVVTLWALKHNAAVRAAKRLEEQGFDQPPGDPEQN